MWLEKAADHVMHILSAHALRFHPFSPSTLGVNTHSHSASCSADYRAYWRNWDENDRCHTATISNNSQFPSLDLHMVCMLDAPTRQIRYDESESLSTVLECPQ